MLKRVGFIMIFAAGLGVVGRPAIAQITDPNKDEAKCQKGTGKALVKFSGAKAKCTSKCLVAQRKISGPYDGCFAPFADQMRLLRAVRRSQNQHLRPGSRQGRRG